MQVSTVDRPTVPLIMSLVGLIVSAIAAVVIGVAGWGMFGTFGYGSMMGGMMGGYNGGVGMMNGYSPWGMSGWGSYVWIWIPILAASIAVAAFGVFLMNSPKLDIVRIGSVLVIVGAVFSFPTAFGFVIGSILMAIGGILGLIWSPRKM